MPSRGYPGYLSEEDEQFRNSSIILPKLTIQCHSCPKELVTSMISKHIADNSLGYGIEDRLLENCRCLAAIPINTVGCHCSYP